MLKFALFFLLSCSPKVWSRSSLLNEPALSFKLIHINDIHAHFEEVNVNTGRCHQNQADAKQCYGGAARIKTMVDRIRNEKPEMDSIFLNAGDYYQVLFLECKECNFVTLLFLVCNVKLQFSYLPHIAKFNSVEIKGYKACSQKLGASKFCLSKQCR